MYQNQIRKNRVAGPGFHVNCRADEFAIASMRGNKAVKNLSQYLPSSANPEIFDIKEYELLVALRDSAAMYHDGYTHCFSALNGYNLPKNISINDPEAIKNHIFEKVKFVGVAVTEQKCDSKLIDQGLVSQVGGVVTILNGGTKAIHPTDKVMLDINFTPGRSSKTRDKGIPREKVRFCITPVADDAVLLKKAAKACKDAGGDGDGQDVESLTRAKENFRKIISDTATKIQDLQQKLREATDEDEKASFQAELESEKEALQVAKTKYKEVSARLKGKGGKSKCVFEATNIQDLQDFMHEYRALNDRIIGKALSFARPGERVEVLLQPRSAL
tara:strand:- start:14544 stop:15536 length:993 start_codon:yes stop_codon:yes gene_type:complete